MAKQRYVNTHFWDDSYVVNLDPIKKLLFLYFLTNPLTNIAGAYEISLRRVSFDTGIPAEKIGELLAEFERENKIFFQDGWVLIANFIKNQTFNPKILKGVEEIVKCCPDWIKDRLSIAYESLSHLNRDLDLNRNSILSENEQPSAVPPSASLPEESESFAERDKFLSAVKETYNSNILSREDRWVETIERAINGKILLADFIGELRRLLADPSRKFNVTPENVLTAAIEVRAKTGAAPVIPNVADKPKYASRSAEMEARGFPKMGIPISEAAH